MAKYEYKNFLNLATAIHKFPRIRDKSFYAARRYFKEFPRILIFHPILQQNSGRGCNNTLFPT